MSEGALALTIEYVCDAHARADRIGPFVTLVRGAWAYCAGHGERDHEWRRIEPTSRQSLDEISGGAT